MLPILEASICVSINEISDTYIEGCVQQLYCAIKFLKRMRLYFSLIQIESQRNVRASCYKLYSVTHNLQAKR